MWDKVFFKEMDGMTKLVYLYYHNKCERIDTCLLEFERMCDEVGLNKMSLNMRKEMNIQEGMPWPLSSNIMGDKVLSYLFDNKICSSDGKNITLNYKGAKGKTLEPQKEESVEEFFTDLQVQMFDEFWDLYPKKMTPSGDDLQCDARTAFQQVKDQATFDIMMSELRTKMTKDSWSKENGKWIPYPAKFIEKHILVEA